MAGCCSAIRTTSSPSNCPLAEDLLRARVVLALDPAQRVFCRTNQPVKARAASRTSCGEQTPGPSVTTPAAPGRRRVVGPGLAVGAGIERQQHGRIARRPARNIGSKSAQGLAAKQLHVPVHQRGGSPTLATSTAKWPCQKSVIFSSSGCGVSSIRRSHQPRSALEAVRSPAASCSS